MTARDPGDPPGRIGPLDCKVDWCPKARHRRGYCAAHLRRLERHGDPAGGRPYQQPPIIIEDLEWMVETGESLTNAARRLGRSVGGLEKALDRLGRRDLFQTLFDREGDWNSPARNDAIWSRKRAWQSRNRYEMAAS